MRVTNRVVFPSGRDGLGEAHRGVAIDRDTAARRPSEMELAVLEEKELSATAHDTYEEIEKALVVLHQIGLDVFLICCLVRGNVLRSGRDKLRVYLGITRDFRGQLSRPIRCLADDIIEKLLARIGFAILVDSKVFIRAIGRKRQLYLFIGRRLDGRLYIE